MQGAEQADTRATALRITDQLSDRIQSTQYTSIYVAHCDVLDVSHFTDSQQNTLRYMSTVMC